MSKFGEMQLKKIFGQALLELADAGVPVAMVDADLMRCSGADAFAAKYPQRAIQVGIAEQNAVGVAAGMAAMGYQTFVSTFATFATMRACDQVRNTAVYNHFPVKVCGTYSGLTSEKNGGTHIAVEDVAIMRAIPTMTVCEPADGAEFDAMVRVAAEYPGPMYLRVPKGPMKEIYPDGRRNFAIGKADWLRRGEDLTFLAYGITVVEALEAAAALEERGISAGVLNVSTIKPLDRDAVIEALDMSGVLVSVENHNIIGGLGSAVAEILAEEGRGRLLRLGLKDCFGTTASLDYQMKQHGLDAASLVKTVTAYMEKISG